MTDQPAKKKKSKLPGQRTMEAMRKHGWVCGVVERWNPHVMIRQDLFGFADIIAIGKGIIAVQATSGGGSGSSNFNARIRKILAEHRAKIWLQSGGRIQVWSWKKGTLNGREKWRHTIHEITLKDFADMPPTPAVASESPVRPTAGDGGIFADDPLGG